jgi:hypothetical protein
MFTNPITIPGSIVLVAVIGLSPYSAEHRRNKLRLNEGLELLAGARRNSLTTHWEAGK